MPDGINISFDTDNRGRMLTRIQQISQSIDKPVPLLRAIARVLRANMAANIDAGGRPGFTPNTRNTLQQKSALGQGVRPLIADGGLRRSVAQENAEGNVTYISASGELRVGSRLASARFARNGTRPHMIKAIRHKVLSFRGANGQVFRKVIKHPGTPPRDFMVIQEDAWNQIKGLMGQFMRAEPVEEE